MKIYTCKENISSSKNIDINEDIVLGYVDSNFIDKQVSVDFNSKYNTNYKKEILPYQTFKNIDIGIYDKNNLKLSEEDKSKHFKKTNEDYIYMQKADTVFTTEKFKYEVLAKKKMKYLTSRFYNLNVGCITTNTAETLIQYFSDSYYRGICPANIRFNNGDRRVEALMNTSFDDTDFVFINSQDGIHITEDIEIPIDDILKANSVPFIFCDNLDDIEVDYESHEELTFDLKEKEITNVKELNTKYYFEYKETGEDETYHKIFKFNEQYSPIIIKEITNKGFIVYCNSEFYSRLDETYDMFYEILMYIYMRNYIKTKTIEEWIADVMPDYIVQNGRLIHKENFTSFIQLHKIFGLQEEDIKTITVDILPQEQDEAPIVYYLGMANNYLTFKKIPNSKYSDPVKTENEISIYTERGNIIFFKNFLYEIQEKISESMDYKIENDYLKIEISNFKSSELNLNFENKCIYKKIKLGNDTKNIFLYYNKEIKDFILTEQSLEHPTLATFSIKKVKNKNRLFDMRLLGGGIKEQESAMGKSLFDLSNVLGKSYRKGGSSIVKISIDKKYKSMEDQIRKIIEQELNKNKLSEDFFMVKIIYKED